MDELNSPTTDHPEDFIGNTLGKYEITQYIGRGGFGTVYLARHTKLGTTRVLKILNDTTNTIITEARKQAAVQHPNIVRIDDVEDETTPNFIVMEHMPDGDLTRLITQTTPDNAIEIMKQVMQGIAHIHANNYNHLDLKPTNILLAGKTAKISDFGLAKTFGDYSEKYRTTQSTTGGTPEYMPPEQTSGIIAPTNDIYSFGITFYQLLTGKLPQEVGFTEIRELNSTVPEALDVLIMKAISQSPRKRQQSARDVLEELDKIQDDDPWTTFVPKPVTRTPNKEDQLMALLQDTPADADFIGDIQTEPDTFSDIQAIPTEPITYDENPTANDRKGLDELPETPTIIIPTRSTTLGGIKVYEHDAHIVRRILATAGRKNLNGFAITKEEKPTGFENQPILIVQDERITGLSLAGIPVTTLSELAELTELQTLNISKTEIKDISPLAITRIRSLCAIQKLDSLVSLLLMEQLVELKILENWPCDDSVLDALADLKKIDTGEKIFGAPQYKPGIKIVKEDDLFFARPKYSPTPMKITQWPYFRLSHKNPDYRGTWNLASPEQGIFELYITARYGKKIAGMIEDNIGLACFTGTIDSTNLRFTKIYTPPKKANMFDKQEITKFTYTATQENDKWTGKYTGKLNGKFEMRKA